MSRGPVELYLVGGVQLTAATAGLVGGFRKPREQPRALATIILRHRDVSTVASLPTRLQNQTGYTLETPAPLNWRVTSPPRRRS